MGTSSGISLPRRHPGHPTNQRHVGNALGCKGSGRLCAAALRHVRMTVTPRRRMGRRGLGGWGRFTGNAASGDRTRCVGPVGDVGSGFSVCTEPTVLFGGGQREYFGTRFLLFSTFKSGVGSLVLYSSRFIHSPRPLSGGRVGRSPGVCVKRSDSLALSV